MIPIASPDPRPKAPVALSVGSEKLPFWLVSRNTTIEPSFSGTVTVIGDRPCVVVAHADGRHVRCAAQRRRWPDPSGSDPLPPRRCRCTSDGNRRHAGERCDDHEERRAVLSWKNHLRSETPAAGTARTISTLHWERVSCTIRDTHAPDRAGLIDSSLFPAYGAVQESNLPSRGLRVHHLVLKTMRIPLNEAKREAARVSPRATARARVRVRRRGGTRSDEATGSTPRQAADRATGLVCAERYRQREPKPPPAARLPRRRREGGQALPRAR